MAANFDYPADFPVVNEDRRTSITWGQWFSRAHNAVASLYQSGTTANRPTKGLWIGRSYMDLTLGRPVWLRSVGPTVWVDATGLPV